VSIRRLELGLGPFVIFNGSERRRWRERRLGLVYWASFLKF